MTRNLTGLSAVLLFTMGSALAQATAEKEGVALTIYSKAEPGAVPIEWYQPAYGGGQRSANALPGYAIIKHQRKMELEAGRSTARFQDVAALIEPTTVTFVSLTDRAGTAVLEQNFEFDLVTVEKLLEKFVDEEVRLYYNVGDSTQLLVGTLLSSMGGYVVRNDNAENPIQVLLQRPASVELGELPEGLITRPTLVWEILAKQAGTHLARVTYETKGVTWWADYNLVFTPADNANDGTIDLSAWVSIINQSGATYADARLKLIAGDVQRVERQRMVPAARGRGRMAMMEADKAGFEEKEFFEYHLYTLGRPTTLANNSTKQLELFPQARDVPVEKKYVYAGQAVVRGYRGSINTNRDLGISSNTKVDVYLELTNSEAKGLGMPLPAGRVRVNQLDKADGTLEFIGEDTIDHTPVKEDIRIRLGSAFDVVGAHKQTRFDYNKARQTIVESFEITVRNRKDTPIRVIVKETLTRHSGWTITEASHEYEKQDAFTVHFPITVPADGEEVVTYTVKYQW